MNITKQRLTDLIEQLTRDLREYPMGQHNPVHYVSREELLELARRAEAQQKAKG